MPAQTLSVWKRYCYWVNALPLKLFREDLVGQALQTLQEKHNIQRQDLFLQTKYSQTPLISPRLVIPYL